MLNLVLIVGGYLFLQMCLVWIIYRRSNNPSIVDMSWSIGLMVSGLLYLWSEAFTIRLGVISFLLIIWGIRLAIYLWYTRIRQGVVDQRYISLSENWKISKSLGFFLNFQLQAFFILIISSVFLFAATEHEASLLWWEYFAIVIVVTGILGETCADQQLYTFKKHHPGLVCNSGLWKYSRHPNYFFEWLIWCGFAMFGLGHSTGYLGLASPLLLYLIMTKITGPMTEEGSIKSKGLAYLEYQRQTPLFFPKILL